MSISTSPIWSFTDNGVIFQGEWFQYWSGSSIKVELNRWGSTGSRWSRGVRRQFWWRFDVDAWSFVSSENDYVLNRSGEWLRGQYQKHQPIGLHRPSYEPIVNDQTSDWERANNQEPLTDQATKVKQLIQERSDRDKASNSFKSGQIATN